MNILKRKKRVGLMRFSLILHMLLLGACTTCFKEQDFEKALLADPPIQSSDFSFLNGEYLCLKYSMSGEETKKKCSTFFRDGVIKHYSGKIISIQSPKQVIQQDDLRVYEFIDKDIEYQLHIRPEKIELVSTQLWDHFIKREEKDEK